MRLYSGLKTGMPMQTRVIAISAADHTMRGRVVSVSGSETVSLILMGRYRAFLTQII